jgi:hypothetical protein
MIHNITPSDTALHRLMRLKFTLGYCNEKMKWNSNNILLKFNTFENNFLKKAGRVRQLLNMNKYGSVCYSTWLKMCMFFKDITVQLSPVKTVYHPFMITYPQVPESQNALVRRQQATVQH